MCRGANLREALRWLYWRQVNDRVGFEWNARKAAGNLRKHGVSFDAVANRFVTFGVSSSGRLLVVAHVDRADSIRIITAREATRAERPLYEEG